MRVLYEEEKGEKGAFGVANIDRLIRESLEGTRQNRSKNTYHISFQ